MWVSHQVVDRWCNVAGLDFEDKQHIGQIFASGTTIRMNSMWRAKSPGLKDVAINRGHNRQHTALGLRTQMRTANKYKVSA